MRVGRLGKDSCKLLKSQCDHFVIPKEKGHLNSFKFLHYLARSCIQKFPNRVHFQSKAGSALQAFTRCIFFQGLSECLGKGYVEWIKHFSDNKIQIEKHLNLTCIQKIRIWVSCKLQYNIKIIHPVISEIEMRLWNCAGD